MSLDDAASTFVVGDTIYEIREHRRNGSQRETQVLIIIDGRFEWTLEEPGWRPIRFGVSDSRLYLWSARSIFALQESGPERVASLDEDILWAFWRQANWLIVCETSIRYHQPGHPSRLQFDTSIDFIRLEGNYIFVTDAEGREHEVDLEHGLKAL